MGRKKLEYPENLFTRKLRHNSEDRFTYAEGMILQLAILCLNATMHGKPFKIPELYQGLKIKHLISAFIKVKKALERVEEKELEK